MAYLSKDDLKHGYIEAKRDADAWREAYPEFERLANNELLPSLDPNLPETNDGTLAAALFKLPKRIVDTSLHGRARMLDRNDAWLNELANIVWEKQIVPNANLTAPFHRKWKDAVRKCAIYGSVPLISLFVERGNYRGADFLVALPQDVKLEPGKVSDYDSDVIWWDVYYTKQQVKNMIEKAQKEEKEAKTDGRDSYNKWNIKGLKEVLEASHEEQRDTKETPKGLDDQNVKKSGIKFCVAFQRGIKAPFYMYHKGLDITVREWENPDPTGDIPVHFLYCYQDFINPYGTGIVKLAGGTQNVLDYMRQADVLATQLGLRPPTLVSGDADSADIESFVHQQDALWFTGSAQVQPYRQNTSIYSELPNRIAMYKTSLNQMLPTGDTSISSAAGDPQYSKTPAGVKFQAANLSIDDEDFKDNLFMTYAAVARSMINTHFANMQGTDILTLDDVEREKLVKAGIPELEGTDQLEIIWDDARANFDFEIDPEADKTKDDEVALDGLAKIAELATTNPQIMEMLAMSGKRLNLGELYSEMIGLLSDNEKIIEEVTPEDQEAMAQQQGQAMGQEQASPQDQQALVNIQAVMQEHGVDEEVAATMLLAEEQGLGTPEEIIALGLQAQGSRQ